MDVTAPAPSAVFANDQARIEELGARSGREQDIAKVRELAKDFESIFLEQMFKSMRSSVQKSGLIDGGNAEEIYTSMLDSEYAKQMSGHMRGGLSEMIERQLLQTMGVKSEVSGKVGQMRGSKAYGEAQAAGLRLSQKEDTIEAGTGTVNRPARK